jgi:TATA-box binding protein (TBP) (component of TFIID and TFIIIB)
MEYRVTNVVLKSVLATGTPLDLPSLANVLTNVVYDPRQFSAIRLRSKKIGGSMLLFANGYAVCHGPATNRFEARRRLRRYARMVQKAGYPDLRVTATGLVTLSLVASVGRRLNLPDVLALVTGSTYEPELHNYLMLRTPHAHFNVFSTGKVVVTGVRKFSHITSDVASTLIELSLA